MHAISHLPLADRGCVDVDHATGILDGLRKGRAEAAKAVRLNSDYRFRGIAGVV